MSSETISTLSDVESGTAVTPGTAASGPGGPGGPPGAGPRRRPFGRSERRIVLWTLVVVAVAAALVVGGSVQRAVDNGNAAQGLYRAQVLSTLSRFTDAESSQLALPPAQRNADVFDNLADSITNDQGVNGAGTLSVDLGAGSAAQPAQIAFTVTVSSPYGSSALVVWFIQAGAQQDSGSCVLGSSLLGNGNGRATTELNLGGGTGVQPCDPQWWTPGPVNATQPRLSEAGIHQQYP